MTIAGHSPAEAARQELFTAADGRSISVERIDRHWTLEFDRQTVETRDLSSGIEELLGKSPDNLALVLRILAWEFAPR